MGEYWKSKDHVEAVQDQKGKHGCKLCNEATTYYFKFRGGVLQS